MKNSIVKFLSLMLASIMMLSAFAACGSDPAPSTGTTGNGPGTSAPAGSSSAATDSGTGAPEGSTAPDVTTAADITTNADVTTAADITTNADVTTAADITTNADVTTAADITTEPDVTTAEATTAPEVSTAPEETTSVVEDTEKIPKDRKIRILFIGNSLTYYNSMPEILEQLGKLDGRQIEVESATQGSGTMQEQINSSTGIGAKVRDYMKQKWDYVVIQPSRRITERDDTVKKAEFEAGQTLDSWIKKTGAKTLLYCTWGNNTGVSKIYRMNTNSFESSTVGEFEISQDAHSAWMQKVNKEYSELLGADIVDCAELFRYLINNQKAYNVYYTDNKHPSLYGSFAVACAFYAYLFGKSPVEPAKKYVGITPAGTAEILAASAAHVILGETAPEQHNTKLVIEEKTYNLKTAEWKGSGTQADPYLVSTAEEFNFFAEKSLSESFKDKYIKMTADISFGGTEIRPVGAKTPFEGHFDGQGHTFSYFSITLDEIAGLFAQVWGAEIKNVNVSCATVLAATSGVIVGLAVQGSVIENCFVDQGSSSTGSSRAGGIVGSMSGSTVRGCRNDAPVMGINSTDTLYCGGICGIAGGNSLITLCENRGDVTSYQPLKSKNGCSGGILGCQGISSASYTGEVSGACNVEKCVNYGTSACTYDGDVESRPYCGGIIGRGAHYNGATYIKECFNFGTIINTGKNKYYGSGQICGVYVYPTVTISDCYGLDSVGAEFTKIHGADPQGGGYLVGKFGQKFSTAQYIMPSATVAELSRDALEAKMKEIIK